MSKGIKIGDTLYHLWGKDDNIVEVKITEIESNKDGIYLYCKDDSENNYRFILIAYAIGKTHFGKNVFVSMEDLLNSSQFK